MEPEQYVIDKVEIGINRFSSDIFTKEECEKIGEGIEKRCAPSECLTWLLNQYEKRNLCLVCIENEKSPLCYTLFRFKGAEVWKGFLILRKK